MQNGYQFDSEYLSMFNRSRFPPLSITTQSIYAQQCYDATWTLARALNLTIKGLLLNRFYDVEHEVTFTFYYLK